jgi:membrane fusion protein, multidrug efflux system
MSLMIRGVGLAVALSLLAQSQMARAQSAAPAIPVSVGKAEIRDVPIFTNGIGTVQPFQAVLLRARVDGTLDKVMFTEGQSVKPGDVLAIIDPRPYQALLDQAIAKKASDTAALANARRDLIRFSALAQKDFASRQSVDTQDSAVAQALASTQADDAAIATAKLNLDFTSIASPIEGRVGLRQVDPGNLIHANDANGIVTINQLHPISVIFTLPQDSLPDVQQAAAGGAPLRTLAFSSDNKQQLSEGTLLTTDNAIDTTTGMIKLKATFPNADNKLWPGQFVNMHLQLRVQPNAVVVPAPAVMRGVNGLYTYVVGPDNVAKVVPLETGQDDGKWVIVTAGLKGNETLVTGGQSRLADGMHVASTAPKPQSAVPANAGG